MKTSSSDRVQIFLKSKESGIAAKKHRHPAWNETYTLYRDRVLTNRITQRQSVNIPLIKYAILSLLKDVDEPPILYFDNIDNEAEDELFYNEYWKETARENRHIIKDIIDKKQVFLFGRSFKKLNIVDGMFNYSIRDPMYILVDRDTDPANLHSSRFLIETNIYRTLNQLEENPNYDKSVLKKLKERYLETEGLLVEMEDVDYQSHDVKQRKADIGIDDIWSPALGETKFELNEFYFYDYDEEKEREVLHVSTMVTDIEESNELLVKPLHDVIGETSDDYWCYHYPYNTWASDPEATDFWNDGVGDILRSPNKVLNTMWSAGVENRTLRNFGMYFYDATQPADSDDAPFVPESWIPEPFGWYGVNGDPNKRIKAVDIPDPSESIDEMEWILGIAEKAVAATSTQQGVTEGGKVTLGEVELALANAKERVRAMAVFYNEAWLEFGLMYTKMLEAAHDLLDEKEIIKKGRQGMRMYKRTINPSSIALDKAYKVDVKMASTKTETDVQNIQKLQVAINKMPENQALKRIEKQKLLEFANLAPAEVEEVLEEEKQGAKVTNNLLPAGKEGRVPNVPAASLNQPVTRSIN